MSYRPGTAEFIAEGIARKFDGDWAMFSSVMQETIVTAEVYEYEARGARAAGVGTISVGDVHDIYIEVCKIMKIEGRA